VLLVDACSADPSLSRALAPEAHVTWAALLAAPEALATHTVRDERTGLAFLPLARADLRLLKKDERRQLAANLAATALDYDLVIIDAGAIVDEDSGMALLPLTDRLAIVARSGVTSRRRLDDTIQALTSVQGKIAGVVLRGARA
jgi:Mrp family chromosome partitioning ATPase